MTRAASFLQWFSDGYAIMLLSTLDSKCKSIQVRVGLAWRVQCLAMVTTRPILTLNSYIPIYTFSIIYWLSIGYLLFLVCRKYFYLGFSVL